MKLKELIKDIECEKISVDEEIEISSLCIKDCDCKEGSAFFCIKGQVTDGSKYVLQAKKRGAVVIITEEMVYNCDIGQIIVKNVRKAINRFCDLFYDAPYKKLRMIAVVGTNGKTTVCELIASILNEYGIDCGKIGTLGASFKDMQVETGFTTPDTPKLYELLDEMVKRGAKAVCMELSAHAIYYEKTNFRFDVAVFTNCTPEHLDFFKTFEEYQEVKLSAFAKNKAKLCVVNGDDNLGKEISCLRSGGTLTYGLEDPVDVFAIDFEEKRDGMRFLINLFDTLYEVQNNYIGKFNVYNMLAAATTCAICGVKTQFIAKKLCEIGIVDGRMERVCEKINVYVDYAHTPDGLKQALTTLNGIKGDKRLICVFGCGGNRDKEKRAKMGEISGELADFTVITSDNPRFEDEDFIIKQIETGIRERTNEYITVRDRKSAIEYAVQSANIGDYILIAGKGAEKFQEQMGVFKPFSDKETAQSAVKRKYE